jgi:putative peptidoglycan lipid II flippase
MLCIALVPAGALGLLSRAYYALGDFRTPVRLSVISLVLNLALNVLFVVAFDMDTGGLALATAVASWLGVAMMLPGLMRRLREGAGGTVPGLPDFGARLAKMAGAAALCGLGAWTSWWALGSPNTSWLVLAVAIGCGITLYIIAAQLLGLPEWGAARDRIRARLPARR